MKRFITQEEVEFIVLQLIDQGKLKEAEEMLKYNGMSSSELSNLKTARYHDWNYKTHS